MTNLAEINNKTIPLDQAVSIFIEFPLAYRTEEKAGNTFFISMCGIVFHVVSSISPFAKASLRHNKRIKLRLRSNPNEYIECIIMETHNATTGKAGETKYIDGSDYITEYAAKDLMY